MTGNFDLKHIQYSHHLETAMRVSVYYYRTRFKNDGKFERSG